MKTLQLSDQDAKKLIKMLKLVVDEHNIDLEKSPAGKFEIKGSGDEYFCIDYRSTAAKTVFNFRECKYDRTLLRININSNFHKNADGTKIFGPRINVFSEEEYHLKGDGATYYKAFPLPYEDIPFSKDFYELLQALLNYTNTENKDKIIFQQNLL